MQPDVASIPIWFSLAIIGICSKAKGYKLPHVVPTEALHIAQVQEALAKAPVTVVTGSPRDF